MELINRYLQAVRFWLPKKQRDDIIAELSEEIRSQVEERERETGRKLGDPEIAAVLKRLGPPATAANRYLPQRSLIGPAVFPTYLLVLKIVFVCCLAPQVLLLFRLWHPGAATSVTSLLAGLGRAGNSTWQSLLFTFGLVTVIFAVIERVAARTTPKNDWDPLRLPPVRDPLRIPRSSSIFGLVFSVLILAWWAGSLGLLTIFETNGARIGLDLSRGHFVPGFVLVMLGYAGLSGVNLFLPRWTVARAGFRLAIDCAGWAILFWLVKAGVLQEVFMASVLTARTAAIMGALSLAISNLLPFAVLVCAIVVIVDVRRVLRTGEGAPGIGQTKPGSPTPPNGPQET